MNAKRIALLTTIILSLSLFSLTLNVAAQDNLLTNPGFEAGHYQQDNISQITVPNGWRMHWLDNVTFPNIHEGTQAFRPETVVWNAQGGVPVGEEHFWRDGNFTLKIFKGWAPIYAALSQDVTGLQPGRSYRFIAPVLADVYDWDGKKVAPWDQNHALVRLGAGPTGSAWRDENAISYSPFWPGSFLEYQSYVFDFQATQANMTVWIEVVGSYPHNNNGFFIDLVSLQALDAVAPVPSGGGGNSGGGGGGSAPAAAPSTPLPPATPRADGAIVHVVSPGDSFWSIAIRYASSIGMSAEEALPHIQELNNNPTFLSTGQELFISLPSANAAAEPEATAQPEEEAVGEGEGEAGEETAVEEPEEAEEEEAPEPTAVPEPVAEETTDDKASVCVSIYDDSNGDGVQDSDEGLMPDAAITLSRAGNTVATYVSDGVNEPYCFADLEDDTYQVQIFPPANYQATATDSWALALTSGSTVPISFGIQQGTAVADTTVADTSAEAEPEAAPADTAAPDQPEEGGLGSNIGTILIGAAILLVLLAGLGVFLLRRG
ncbi:MAG: SdrD B-like domain-containing protein [Chloroflexota bacterium]